MEAWPRNRGSGYYSTAPTPFCSFSQPFAPANSFPEPLFKDQNTAATLSEKGEEKKKTTGILHIKHEMKGVGGGASIPKQRGLLQMCFPKFRTGKLEEAELQKEPKTGQTEEVAFRKTTPHPAQQNLARLPLM